MKNQGFNLKIRGKLILSFMTMIILTVIVAVVAYVSQTNTQKVINDVLQVQGQIARLSMKTDIILGSMTKNEKDFFLKLRSDGIQEAKSSSLNQVIAESGQAYETLYQIQQLSTEQANRDSAQTAMEAINEYLSAFIAMVNILELRVDPDFGELVKLEEANQAVRENVQEIDDVSLEVAYYTLNDLMTVYLNRPGNEEAASVAAGFDELSRVVTLTELNPTDRQLLQGQIQKFQEWFTNVSATDATIAERSLVYQSAAEKTTPILQSFMKNAADNESTAIEAMQKTEKIANIVILAVGGLAILLGLLIAVRLSGGLTKQVNHIMDLLTNIGMGDFDSRTEVVSTDELGTMATTLNAMLDNITILIQSQDERDVIQNSIMTLLEEISDLTEGDLTARAEVTEDITGAIADSFNTMAGQFGDIIKQVKSTTSSVNETSTDVSKLTVELANKSIAQTTQVNNAVGSIETMVASIQEVFNNALQSAEVSSLSRTHAREGAEAVNQTNLAMNEIRDEINETARSIKRLGESSMEIGNIVQIINDIADRTSILALNASIQAAMAGDAGHGFAVVAEEVQRLSESSSSSTKQIEALVRTIQTEIKDVGNRMDDSISKVVAGSKLADNAHEKLQNIESVSNQLAELIESISQASTRQVEVSEEITTTMREVGKVSQETSLASQQTAKSMASLSSTAHRLTAAVEMFKIELEQGEPEPTA